MSRVRRLRREFGEREDFLQAIIMMMDRENLPAYVHKAENLRKAHIINKSQIVN